MGERLTITDLGARTGLASSALRFYERKRLLRPVGRAGGKRLYDEGAVEQVALIDLLKLAGFTLGEIAALVDTEGHAAPDWRDRVKAKLGELDRRLDEMRVARSIVAHTMKCPHDRFDSCPVHQEAVQTHAANLREGVRRAVAQPTP